MWAIFTKKAESKWKNTQHRTKWKHEAYQRLIARTFLSSILHVIGSRILQLVLETCCLRTLSQGPHSGAQKPLKQFVEKKYHSQQQQGSSPLPCSQFSSSRSGSSSSVIWVSHKSSKMVSMEYDDEVGCLRFHTRFKKQSFISLCDLSCRKRFAKTKTDYPKIRMRWETGPMHLIHAMGLDQTQADAAVASHIKYPHCCACRFFNQIPSKQNIQQNLFLFAKH
jgi:hypothetical protein